MPRDAWETVQRLEKRLYLRNQLLRDADWAGMAHGVEIRVPLVDARLRVHGIASEKEAAEAGDAVLKQSTSPGPRI